MVTYLHLGEGFIIIIAIVIVIIIF